MSLSGVDYFVIGVYLLAITAFGSWFARYQKTTRDYFLTDRSVPWWAICFTIVATETSTLTFIGIPAQAYTGNMTFLQLAVGYIIGRVIEAYAKRFGYGVVRDFTGHGIGTSFHSGLIIPHYDDERFDDEIRVGMTFTIEPMLNLGTPDYDMWDDGWTVVTKDLRRSAQFEHTLLVTEDGAEVLTHP